jgi:glycosyltransferase involved in cell wall biosynthesis
MKKSLLHLTWDSPDNPWCGGGGAFRDYRILERLSGWEREVWSGRHPKGSNAPDGTCRTDFGICSLGEFISRRSWAWSVGRILGSRFLTDPSLIASQSISAWAPVWQSIDYPNRILHVVHHIAGKAILERLGPFGPSSFAYEQQILSHGRYFATPNRATASRIREVNTFARIEIIPNGFDPPSFAPPTSRMERPHDTIVFLGRLDHRMKGLDRLFAAFGKVASINERARLVVAGRADRSMDSWICNELSKHPARDRIEIVPNPTDERKYQVLDDGDIFCVPSRFEGWCIAAVEAQSRGLPVVATRTDGLQDSVSDCCTGMLVSNSESDAVDALVASLQALLADRHLRSTMGAAAIAWANRFTWDAATRSTETFLDEIRQTLV